MKTFISRNWWSFLLNGFIAITYGLLALFIPAATLIVLVKYTGFLILFTGLVFLSISVLRIMHHKPYALMVSLSIITLLFGGIITFKTQGTIQLIVLLLGVWALVSGVFQLMAFLTFDKSLNNKGLIIANIILTLVFGIVLLLNPFAFATYLVVISGVLALLYGILYIWFGIKMRHIQ